MRLLQSNPSGAGEQINLFNSDFSGYWPAQRESTGVNNSQYCRLIELLQDYKHGARELETKGDRWREKLFLSVWGEQKRQMQSFQSPFKIVLKQFNVVRWCSFKNWHHWLNLTMDHSSLLQSYYTSIHPLVRKLASSLFFQIYASTLLWTWPASTDILKTFCGKRSSTLHGNYDCVSGRLHLIRLLNEAAGST